MKKLFVILFFLSPFLVFSQGRGISQSVPFSMRKSVAPPLAITQAATSVGDTAVGALNGSVTCNGGATTVTFEYGLTTAYGSSITASQSPISSGTASVSAAITDNLQPEVTYHYRVKAVNSAGTTYGSDATFTTDKLIALKTNTWAWYRYADSVVQTANSVRRWGDFSGNGRYLAQSADSAKPALEATGISFDGINDVLKSTANLSQPVSVYFVIKEISFTSGDYILSASNSAFRQLTSSGSKYALFSGVSVTTTQTSVTGTFRIIFIEYNDANSIFGINNGTESSINVGTNTVNTPAIGGSLTGLSCSNIILKEVIFRTVADNARDRARIVNYLNGKYNIFSGSK